MAHPFMWLQVLKLLRWFTAVLFLLTVATGSAAAQHRLCDPANEDCRDLLISHIRAETIGLDVAFWFMEDAWMAQEVIDRWRSGVPVRILVDTEANSPNPRNALRLAEFEAAGIPMRERTASGILHWKMMLFAGQNVVEFSGANYSSDAWLPQTSTDYENYIDEAIIFTSDPSIVNSFKTKYDDLWTNTSTYTNYRNITRPLWRVYSTYAIDSRLNFVPDQSYFARAREEFLRETVGIDVTMYRITDWRFSDAMIKAEQRGVPVRLLTEPQQYRDVRRLWHSYNVDLLYMNGVEIKHRVHAGLNHQKSLTLRGLGEVIFGSSNWSSASAEYQEEHNLITDDPATFEWFTDQFERKWGNLSGIAEYGPFAPLPPDAPKTPSPATGVQGLATTGITLRWDGGPWAHRYDVYLGTHPSEMVVVGSDLPLGPSEWEGHLKSYAIGSPLLPGTTYYWRIVGRTMANMTASSPTWTFKTAGTAPQPPSVTLLRHPYLQQLTPISAVIAWTTRESGPAKVRYASSGGDVMSALATTTEFSPATTGMTATYYQHVVRLTGLTPSTTYTYDILVSERDLNSPIDRFTTPPTSGGTVRFIAFGDSGTGSTQQAQLAARMASDTFDFALHGGDLAYGNSGGTGGATYQTMEDWFFTMYASWLRGRPVFPAIGNHDSRATNANGRPYLDMFVLPENGGSAAFPDHAERYYSFDYGPLHVVVLDTELAFQGPDLSRRHAQLAWLDADLAATLRPWKVALFHRSPYSAGGEHGSDLEVRSAFAPIFEARGVQLVISAHEHDYERTVRLRASVADPAGVTYVVTGGGGAPLYAAGTAPWTAHSASVHHYVKGTATNCTIRLEAVRVDGVIFDAVTLRQCDDQPPAVAITSPATGATVTGNVTIQMNASDDVAVARVEIRVNGTLLATDTAAPYAVAWNTALTANGSHTVTARAVDASGNMRDSAAVVVTVSNVDTQAPAARITAPANGTVWGLINVTASATDNVGVTRVDLLVDGVVVATRTAGPYMFPWDTTVVAQGLHQLVIRARDAAGNVAVSPQVSVRVRHLSSEQDFDGNGRMDLLFQHLVDGRLLMWSMNGATRTSWQMLDPGQVRPNWRIVGTADLNKDGTPDIIWQDESEGWIIAWFMNGVRRTGFTYLAPWSQVADPMWRIVSVVDMNADGDADLVFRHAQSGALAAWLMTGTTVVARVGLAASELDTSWEIVGNGDFNGDGRTDLLWRRRADGSLMVWMMDGLTQGQRVDLSPSRLIDLDWEIVATGDLNGDGRCDIVFQHRSNGGLVAWWMDGVNRTHSTWLTPDRLLDTNWRIVGPK